MVGSSGIEGSRFALVAANIFTLPSRACGSSAPPSNIMLTRPVMRSGTAVVVPL